IDDSSTVEITPTNLSDSTLPDSTLPESSLPGSTVAETASPSRAAKEADAAAKALIAALADLPADSPDRPRVRQRLIEAYLPLTSPSARTTSPRRWSPATRTGRCPCTRR